jgi:hypothetical protein
MPAHARIIKGLASLPEKLLEETEQMFDLHALQGLSVRPL